MAKAEGEARYNIDAKQSGAKLGTSSTSINPKLNRIGKIFQAPALLLAKDPNQFSRSYHHHILFGFVVLLHSLSS